MRIYGTPELVRNIISSPRPEARRVRQLIKEGAVSLWSRDKIQFESLKTHLLTRSVKIEGLVKAKSPGHILTLLRSSLVPLFTVERENDYLLEEIEETVNKVLASGKFILGKNLEKLENAIAEYVNSYFVAVGSGTDAIELMLRASLKPPGAVITSPFTFFATVESIINAGFTPLFVDVEGKSCNISPHSLENFLRKECQIKKGEVIHRKTGFVIKGILAVHLYGQPANLEAINEVLKGTKIKIFEDAAQALGARVKVKSRVYSAGSFGQAGAISFYPSKTLGAAGDGGGVITGNRKLAEILKALRDHGKIRGTHMLVGRNSRLDEIQSAILLLKFRHFEKWRRKREKIAERYLKELSKIENLSLPEVQSHVITHAWHLFTVRTPLRDRLQKFLAEKNIESRVYYPDSILKIPAIKKIASASSSSVTTAEQLSREVLSIPCGALLCREEVDRVINAVKEFFSKEKQ